MKKEFSRKQREGGKAKKKKTNDEKFAQWSEHFEWRKG
jgi:hypothetical protein